LVFVCGPEGFTEFCLRVLEELGVEKERVYCEKWW
jgi:ferredoxin-NADP reductase